MHLIPERKKSFDTGGTFAAAGYRTLFGVLSFKTVVLNEVSEVVPMALDNKYRVHGSQGLSAYPQGDREILTKYRSAPKKGHMQVLDDTDLSVIFGISQHIK